MYSVMTTLVDAFFEDDNEYWRLMNMINNGTSKGVIEECSPFSGFKEDIMYLKEDLTDANQHIDELEAKNAELEAEKSELEAKINELESKLNGK